MRRHIYSGSRKLAAFTLVELLVVIGIIAILVSILLPSLAKARNQANSVKCASNMRQLYMACAMFAGENKDHLPRPSIVGSDRPTIPEVDRTTVFAQEDLPGKPAASGRADLKIGALWRYIPGIDARRKVILCPSDNGEKTQGGGPVSSGEERNFSYSWNAYITDPNDQQRGGGKRLLGIQLGRVRNPGDKIMICEELAPNDGWWLVYDLDGVGTTPRGDDWPAGRHAGQRYVNSGRQASIGTPDYQRYLDVGRANHVFFDGHVAVMAPRQIMTMPQGPKYFHIPSSLKG